MANLESGLIRSGEAACLIRDVYLNNTYDLGGINLDVILADMIAGRVNGYLAAVRRISRLIDVMQTLGTTCMGGIEFNDKLVGQTGNCGSLRSVSL